MPGNPYYPNNLPLMPSMFSFVEIDLTVTNPTAQFVFNNSLEYVNPDAVIPEYPFAEEIMLKQTGASGLNKFYLPNAKLGATGYHVKIFNKSSSTVTIHDYTDTTLIATIPASDVYYIMLSNNTSESGNWITVEFGATSSSADASALAGYGLTAFSDKLNIFNPPIPFSTPLGAIPADYAFKTLVWTGGSDIQTLYNQANGFTLFVKNNSSTSSVLVLQPQSGLIDNIGSLSLNYNDGVYLFTDGTNWFSIGLANGIPGVINFDINGIKVKNGSASIPSYSFINASSTGLFYPGSGSLGVTASGVQVASFDVNGIQTTGGKTYQDNGILLSNLWLIYP